MLLVLFNVGWLLNRCERLQISHGHVRLGECAPLLLVALQLHKVCLLVGESLTLTERALRHVSGRIKQVVFLVLVKLADRRLIIRYESVLVFQADQDVVPESALRKIDSIDFHLSDNFVFYVLLRTLLN